jgi:8-oxo-dGTP diphosphatase
MLKEIHVSAAILVQDGKILAAQRAEHDLMGGLWEFPGGKLEEGESPEACLIRELEEELGLTAAVVVPFGKVVYDYPTFRIHLYAFWCKPVASAVEKREHQALRWLEHEELLTLNWAPADWLIVEQLVQGHKPNHA